MSLLISVKRDTGDYQYRNACGLSVFKLAMAVIEEGEDLVCISPNKGEHPITVAQIYSAKRNRDRFIQQGIPCEPLPML